MKAQNKKVTANMQNHIDRRLTLTNFNSFSLLENKKRPSFVKQCRKEICFPTYWSGIRNALNRVHKLYHPDWTELTAETLLQKGNKLEDYLKVCKNYIQMFNSKEIKGYKTKKIQSNLCIENLTIKLNPELTFVSEEKTFVIKLHFSKHQPMTRLVAEQAIALLEIGFGDSDALDYFIFDVYQNEVFESQGMQKAALERAVINCRSFLYFNDLLNDNIRSESA